jgi:tetratricopeptide (TPR) repeat protein
MPPGKHRVRITKDGYFDQERTINATGGTHEVFTLLPVLVSITVTTDPPEAEVYLDGVYKGTSKSDGALQITLVTLGEHQVQVRRKGFFIHDEAAKISKTIRSLRVKLAADPIAQRIRVLDEALDSGRLPEALDIYAEVSGQKPDHADLNRALDRIVEKLQVRSQSALSGIGPYGLRIDPATVKEMEGYYQLVRPWRNSDPSVGLHAEFWTVKTLAGNSTQREQLDQKLKSLGGRLQSNRHAAMLFDLGWIYWGVNDRDRAYQSFVEAQAANVTWAYPYFGLGMLQMAQAELDTDKKAKTSDYNAAIAKFNQALNLDPSLIRAYVFKSLSFAVLNKHKEAIGSAQQAIAVNPQSGYAQFALGFAYYQKGKSNYPMARTSLETATTTRVDPLDDGTRARAQQLILLIAKAGK